MFFLCFFFLICQLPLYLFHCLILSFNESSALHNVYRVNNFISIFKEIYSHVATFIFVDISSFFPPDPSFFLLVAFLYATFFKNIIIHL